MLTKDISTPADITPSTLDTKNISLFYGLYKCTDCGTYCCRRYRGDSEAAAGVPHPAAEAGAASCREKAGQLRRRTEREDGQYTVHRVN